MTAVYYPAIIERGAHGYGVFFPDLPGCVSAGDTLQDAARNAEEALDLHLSGLAEDGVAFPAPSDLDAIPTDPDVIEAARMLVRGEQPGRSVRVQVSIDEGLLARIDRVAPNRSGFLADAARVALAARNA
ncbi:type II toxin-antitoxin system HicB family antitoxin [Sphingomonas sp.]|uniref:type II toxin-antitoxin system HicB family antitoxin n=1 Tax=Sphingomonas sp. TaxID=28214 RepID=UPI00333FC716